MNNELIIRVALLDDLPKVLDLYRALETDSHFTCDRFDPEAQFKRMKLYPYHKLFVAEIKDFVVGTFTLTIIEYLCHFGKNAGVMEAVVVHSQYRSLGIGKQMVAFALARCRENNCYKMSLSSNIVREQAHAFYEREGFKLHGYSLYTDIIDNSTTEFYHGAIQ